MTLFAGLMGMLKSRINRCYYRLTTRHRVSFGGLLTIELCPVSQQRQYLMRELAGVGPGTSKTDGRVRPSAYRRHQHGRRHSAGFIHALLFVSLSLPRSSSTPANASIEGAWSSGSASGPTLFALCDQAGQYAQRVADRMGKELQNRKVLFIFVGYGLMSTGKSNETLQLKDLMSRSALAVKTAVGQTGLFFPSAGIV